MLLDTIFDPVIENALREDLAGGDLSTEACVPPDRRALATAVAKSPLVVCGGAVFRRVFEILGRGTVRCEEKLADGTKASGAREVLWTLEGPAQILLMGERTALNLVQRMSGTATLARQYVDALPAGATTRITDIRKTTPGLRYLERYAVRAGGAHNHRDMLGSAVMIKDNHIVAAGGIARAVEKARERAPHTSKIEVEVANFDELDQALQARADIVMLDNFSLDETRRAVPLIRAFDPRITIESSGNITPARVRELSEAGVDVISVGALTHSAPAADISLGLQLETQ